MSSSNSNLGPKYCKVCNNAIVEQFDSYVDSCTECLAEHSKILMKADGVWVWQEADD